MNLSRQYFCCWPRTDYTYRIQTLPGGDLHFYPVHGLFNGVAYPAYHRMDVRLNRPFTISRGEIPAFLQIISFYNRENLNKFDLEARNDDGEYSLNEQGNYVQMRNDNFWLGLTPALGVEWSL